jgi:hypothetical protein
MTNSLTVYALFATPFVLVFDKFSDDLRYFEFFVDVVFTIDILLTFIRLKENHKEKDLRKY